MVFYYYNLLPVIGDEKISHPVGKLFKYDITYDSDEYDEYKVTLTEEGKKEHVNNIVGAGPMEDEIGEIIDKIISSAYSLKIYKNKIIEIRADLVDVKSEGGRLVRDILVSIYTELKSVIHDHLFSNLEAGISIILGSDAKYLFCWDDVPEKDNGQLIKFLRDNLKIEWTENAEIKKSKNKETITVTNKNKNSESITIKLNKTEKKVSLEYNGETHEYILKEENGKLNIVTIQNIRKEIYEKYIEIKERAFKVHIHRKTKERHDILRLEGLLILNYIDKHTWLSQKIASSRNLIGGFEYLESIIEGFEKNIEKTHKTDMVKTWISKLQDAQNSIKFGYQVFALSFVFLVAMNSLIKFTLNIANLNISYDFVLSLWIWISLCISLWIFNAIAEGETKAIFDVTNVGIKHDL